MPLTARQIHVALRDLHPRHDFVFFDEMRVGAGASAGASDQRIDAFAMGTSREAEYVRIAYEVKASRSDFLRELANPEKRRAALWLSNQFYFVTPKGLVSIDELPPEAGLIEVWEEPNQGHLICDTVRSAIWRESEPPNWRFLAALARRIRTQEESEERAHPLYELARCAKEVDRLGFFEKVDQIYTQLHGKPDAYARETFARLRTALKRAHEHIEIVR